MKLSVTPFAEKFARAGKYNFVIRKSKKNNKYYFSVVAGNNKIVCQGQGYRTKYGAEKTIKRLKKYLFFAGTKDITNG